jgi:hypothetical protein
MVQIGMNGIVFFSTIPAAGVWTTMDRPKQKPLTVINRSGFG